MTKYKTNLLNFDQEMSWRLNNIAYEKQKKLHDVIIITAIGGLEVTMLLAKALPVLYSVQQCFS